MSAPLRSISKSLQFVQRSEVSGELWEPPDQPPGALIEMGTMAQPQYVFDLCGCYRLKQVYFFSELVKKHQFCSLCPGKASVESDSC